MNFVRIVASCLVPLACGACQILNGNPPPAVTGGWHVEGSSNALLQTSDGDFDEDTLRGTVQAGRFMSEAVLVEGLVGLDITNSEVGGSDVDTRALDLGVGGRYYFDTVSARRPYVGGLIGLRYANVDIEGGSDEDDTAPFFQLRGGLEMFMTQDVALDLGLMYQHVNGLDLGGNDDDVNSLGAFVGLSIWI